uniref:Uncharacterized protein n=1 Tax=Helicotheca tamesis TaxID=374047 RepID=A0A7S2I4Q4_9STRA
MVASPSLSRCFCHRRDLNRKDQPVSYSRAAMVVISNCFSLLSLILIYISTVKSFTQIAITKRQRLASTVVVSRQTTKYLDGMLREKTFCKTDKTGLYMAKGGGGSGGFFDNIGKFFDELNNGGDGSEDENGEDDMDFIGSSRIFTIPAKSIKIGGLRLFLTLYLMGQQNSPEKGSWKANQSGDATIDLIYRDQSGALMVNFKEDKITIDRLGSAPSTKYLMHESQMLNGLLDELENIVDGGDVNEDDRLLVLPAPGDAINKARDTIAFS